MKTETYLEKFEEAIRTQARMIGPEKAHDQARRAGLSVSPTGHIVSCVGHPAVVLLRLMRMCTEDGNLRALEACSALMDEIADIVDHCSETEKPSIQ